MAESIIFSGGAVSVADGKGRFVLPLDMRKSMRQSSDGETRLCITIDPALQFAKCHGTSHKQWLEQQIVEKERNALEKGLDYDGDADREAAFADLEDLNFDDGGRFFLPADIRRLLNIDDAVVFSGVGRTIQIWNPETFLGSEGRSPRLRIKVEEFIATRKSGGGK